MRLRALSRFLLAGGGLLALGYVLFAAPSLQVVYNASSSVPEGWYRITSADSLAAGDWVLVRLPPQAMGFAAQRGYLPATVPLLKPVAAVAPQRVCVKGRRLLIDDRVVAKQMRSDRLGRALPAWRGCRRLVNDELLLLSTSHEESFDSRYFGPVSANTVIGRALPLWQETP